MGASFCNLYCKNEHANSLRERLPKGSRLLTGYGEWSVLLLQEFNCRKLMYLARFVPGDVLIFYLYDDEGFGLYYYRDGKKVSFLDCGEYNQKVRKMAENLFPDDPLALKKLWAIKRGVSVDEKLALLEETFGLPFDVAYEQEEIPPVAKSSETYDRMNARAKALRNRPNRYEPELLPKEMWPAILQRGNGKFFPGIAPGARLLLTNAKGHRVVFRPVEGIACSDSEGREQWSFLPDLSPKKVLLEPIISKNGITVVRAAVGDSTYTAWQLSPEDGSVLAQRDFAEDDVRCMHWCDELDCYVYFVSPKGTFVFLDRDLNEIRRVVPEEKIYGFYCGCYAGHCAYTSNETKDRGWEIIKVDLLSSAVSRIRLELPLYPHFMILSGACLCCGAAGFTFDSLVFFGWDGKVISRHHLEHIWDIREEAGTLYGVAVDDNTHNITGVYLFREKEKPGKQ
ncbi:MAG: hypothetical protein IKZ98_14245 [Clostridia bacterium]|nr:hypothetical protein [Clostridia bacterium]